MIENLLGPGLLTLTVAKWGSYKTWNYLVQAVAVATGNPYLDFPVDAPGRVLILNEDMDGADLGSWLLKVQRGYGIQCRLPIYLATHRGWDFLNGTSVDNLRGMVENVKPSLLVIDNLSKVSHSGDENSNDKMSRVMDNLNKVIKHYQVSLDLIHHEGKKRGEGRGASAIYDTADIVINQSSGKKDTIEWKTEKTRFGPLNYTASIAGRQEDSYFRLEAPGLGAVVNKLTSFQKQIIRYLGRNGESEKKALERLANENTMRKAIQDLSKESLPLIERSNPDDPAPKPAYFKLTSKGAAVYQSITVEAAA